ncbi:hypothetical protein B0T26DRAFT_745686 [Lasiosphaeria miniovina]|uniref:Autophagy-related protein 29 n=1 Tax=Lasiosphaeria miniovina TaxID=1954250 RepID=A0AA40BG77_9PEZI|nr:uncharacterized protein B0T26DRAFT_745686 [Lasiosphaeria miniovina]KAK0733665.1 hypothetical protein B0T26DRAFT_745686 [Lasiosphaeria miniovina]
MASKEKPEQGLKNPEPSLPSKEKKEPKYHVYIRLPFNRGDFVDPPPMDWDERKSEALWGIISGASQTEIDWDDLAVKFDVTVEFLLQMASYLAERHNSQLRAQMQRKAAITRGSTAPSPVPGAEPVGYATAEAMRRTGSGGGRTPSALSIRKETPAPKSDGNTAPTPTKTTLPLRPTVSRNSSANTAVLTQIQIANKATNNRLADSYRPRLPSLPISTAYANPTPKPGQDAELPPPSPAASTSSPTSSSSDSPVQSRIIRRPPRFQAVDAAGDLDGDDEAEPAFLPFKAQSPTSIRGQDMGATLRGDVRDFGRRLPKTDHKDQIHHSQTSDSSTSSAAMVPRQSTNNRKPPGPLSPRRTAELVGRSPTGKGKGMSREGSDGAPSMGSSFSDLDDASVTQSALEEALASRMDGTIGSRMSTIGQAIRSRYLPKSNQP